LLAQQAFGFGASAFLLAQQAFALGASRGLLGALALRRRQLLTRRHQPTPHIIQPQPTIPPPTIRQLRHTQPRAQHLTPTPTPLVHLNRHITLALQPIPHPLPSLLIVPKILPRPKHLRKQLQVLARVLALRAGRGNLHNQVRKTVVLVPHHPVLAPFCAVHADHNEQVGTFVGRAFAFAFHEVGDALGLFAAVEDEHVGSAEVVGASFEVLVDDFCEELLLQGVVVAFQGSFVLLWELELSE
jgi:hypothetical protein